MFHFTWRKQRHIDNPYHMWFELTMNHITYTFTENRGVFWTVANLLGDENQIPHPHIKLPKSMGNPNYHMYTVTVEHFFRDTCHFLKNSVKKSFFFVQIYALFQLTVSLTIPSGCIFAVVNTELFPKLYLRVFIFTCLYLDHSRLQNACIRIGTLIWD